MAYNDETQRELEAALQRVADHYRAMNERNRRLINLAEKHRGLVFLDHLEATETDFIIVIDDNTDKTLFEGTLNEVEAWRR